MNDTYINVVNTNQDRDDSGKFQPREELAGMARFRDAPDEGRLEVSLGGKNRWGDYNVIDTDYETYALVYGCGLRNGIKDESAWVLTRDAIDTLERRPDESEFIKAFEANIQDFDYTYVFKDTYSVQGIINGCDGPMEGHHDDKDAKF